MKGRIWLAKGLMSLAGLVVATGPNVAQTKKPTTGTATAVSKPAAVVNGVTIATAEVDGLLKSRGPADAEMTENQKKQLRQLALNKLIDDLLLKQFLQKFAPKLEQAVITKKLGEMEAALKKCGKTLEELSKESGLSVAQMRMNAVARFQLDAYLEDKVKEADLKRYYNENRDFFDGVLVKASHIVLRVSPKATEKDRKSAQDKLLAIRQQIVAKKITFTDAAKKYSESETAPKGGDLGFFPRKGLVEEPFAQAAYALKVGQISDVVQTDFGLHLIQVTERKAGQASEYEKIKDGVKEFYVEELIQNTLEEQRKAAKITVYMQ